MKKFLNLDLKWWILLTVMVGTFLGRLDQTVVNLALPKIMGDFSITISQAGWIATAYILANAIFVPIWGKLGDTKGRKKVYLWGFGIFIVGSILAGISWDLNSMLFFRVIQAIASSADYPTAMAIIAITFREPKERAGALGVWSASFAAATVFGPLIGGPLIDMFGWRSVFLINLPVGLIGIAMALTFVPESVSDKKTHKFDIWGALTLGIALSALVLVLDQGLDWGWTSTNSLMAYLTVLIFLYLFYRIDSTHPEPIVDFKFFRINAFVGALTNNFLIFMGMMGALFTLPVFVQNFLGYSATETGFLFMPMAFSMMIAAPFGASLVGKVKPNIVIAASTFVAGIGLLLFLGLDIRAGPIDLVFPIMIMAFGMGFGMSQRTSIIASAVPENEVGIASSVLALVRNISGAFGIALFATIINNTTETNVLAMAQNTVIRVKSPLVIGEAAALIGVKAEILSFHSVFIIGAAILFVGAALALLIKGEIKKGKTTVMID